MTEASFPAATRLRNAVAAYCDKYSIAPAFPISESFDIKNPKHWGQPDWPNGQSAGCYAFYSASGDLLYIGKGDHLGGRIGCYFSNDGDCGAAKDWGWSAPPRYVQTIPVNEPHEHVSLEAYLIGHLHPSDNTRGSWPRFSAQFNPRNKS